MSGMMGLDIGVRALKAQQRALDVISHNIANANTEGYSRQRAELVTTPPFTHPSKYSRMQAGQVGTGVEVEAIIRLRNAFIDGRFRDENSILGEWEQRSNTLHEIELILGEPSEYSLRSALNNFWSSLQELSTHPEGGGERSAVRQSAAAMTDLFNSLRTQLGDYQRSIDGYIKGKIGEINVSAKKIADLNKQISQIVGKGENPNDLLDKRDLLIDQISKLVNVEVSYDSRGKANVSIGGYSLVSGNNMQEIAFTEDHQKNGLAKLIWVSTNQEIEVTSGEMAGLLESRDDIIPRYITELDTLARTFVFEFNKIHQEGYGLDNSTNIKFFEGADASNIRVSDVILDETNGLNKIAAAMGMSQEGDGSNALRLSEVMQVGLLSGDKVSMSDYWGGIVSGLGVEAQRALSMKENETNLTEQIDLHRQSISGVNLDEEFGNLIKFQHGYNAAAQLIKTQNDLLDTLVNGILK